MKKLFITIVAFFLPMLAMGQLLYENDFTSNTSFENWYDFDASQTDGKVELTSEGLAITVGIQTGELWQPQVMVVPDGSFNLEAGSKYTVVVTAKFPTSGTLQINMGKWEPNDETQFSVEATGDFQEVVCEFPDWSVNVQDAHLVFMCGDFKGTTILKKIEIWKGEPLHKGGIYYNFIEKGKVAEVIQNPDKYKGNIIIPEKVTHEGVEYSVKKIGDNAFNDCSGLASVTIPNSVTSIGDGAFNKCSGLTFITIPNSVTSIGYSAFEGCSGLTSFTIPNSMKSIGYGAFYNCNSLTSVAFPNSFITLGSSVFEYCGNLKHVYISDLDIWCNMNSNETIIHYPHHIYLNGEEIINLTIPSSITSISFAFANCAFIESVNIGSSVTSIDGAFSNCTSLTSIDIPSNVTSIGVNAFNGCTSLSSIKLPSNLTSIGGGAFAGCTSLSSINLPSNLTSIGGSAFAGCTSLISIDIPLNVTYIEVAAFEGCKSLTTVTIPNSVTNIRREVFQNCAKLENVYCMIEELSSLSIGSSVFDGSYIEYATLHVPASAINVYKTTAPWSGFGEFKTLSGEAIETKKCTTPTISFENGEIIFSCETEGVEYISNITAPDAKAYYDGRIKPTYKYTVSVYATKAGFQNSDTATAEFSATGVFGDLNGDGKVNVADHVKLTEIIMSEGE